MRQEKAIEEKLDEKRDIFEKAVLEEKLKSETIDVTLPGKNLQWDTAIQIQ